MISLLHTTRYGAKYRYFNLVLCFFILGDHGWILWRKEIDVLSDFLYFFLTTVQGYFNFLQTFEQVLQKQVSLFYIKKSYKLVFT